MMTAERPRRGGWCIAASLVLALALTALPLPEWAAAWRPAWVASVLIYWCMALPQRVGLFAGWFCGLLLDVQQGTLLGLHALGMVLVAWLTIRFHQRMRLFPRARQAMLVGGYLLLYQAVVLLGNLALGLPAGGWRYWMPAFTSMLLWPWLFIVLRDLRWKFVNPPP